MTPGVPTQKIPGYPIGPVLGIRLGQYWVSDWATPSKSTTPEYEKSISYGRTTPPGVAQNSAPHIITKGGAPEITIDKARKV
jgi:hypothetical protein